MLFNFILLFYLLDSFANCAVVSGIFTSLDSIVYQQGANYGFDGPGNPSWVVTMSWEINGGKVSPKDTFVLTLPCVFKFTATTSTVDLKVADTIYATCSFQPGDVILSYSQLSCQASDNIKSNTEAKGTIKFPLTFNVGGSALEPDLTCSTRWKDGDNVVTFFDGDRALSTTAKFQGDILSSPTDVFIKSRVIPSLNVEFHYLSASHCTDGYTSGKLGFTILASGVSIDCSSVYKGLTSKINKWYVPTDASELSAVSVSCTATSYSVSYQNIPSGYLPFLTAFMKVNTGVANKVQYVNEYTCKGSTKVTRSQTILWSTYQNSSPGGSGQAVFVTTSTFLGSTTSVTTLPFIEGVGTKTVVVNVPIPTITTTTTWDKTISGSTTVTANPGATATVIVQVPVSYTTTTVTWDKSFSDTLTLSYKNGETATVSVNVPIPTVTTTTTWDKTISSSSTITAKPGSTATIIVQVPVSYTTTTVTWDKSSSQTTTLAYNYGETATVSVNVPIPTTTITSTWDELYSSMTTIPGEAGETATVIVQVPIEYVTTTVTWDNSSSQTTTLPYNYGETATVSVNVPIPTTTITSTWDELYSSMTTIPGEAGETATVIVQVPMSYTTVIITWEELYSHTTTLPYDDVEVGTILINVPIPTQISANYWDDPDTDSYESYLSDEAAEISRFDDADSYISTRITWDETISDTTTSPYEDDDSATIVSDEPASLAKSTSVQGDPKTSEHSSPDVGEQAGETSIGSYTLSYTTIIVTWDQSYTQTTTLPYEDGETATILINVPVPVDMTSTTSSDPEAVVNVPVPVEMSSTTLGDPEAGVNVPIPIELSSTAASDPEVGVNIPVPTELSSTTTSDLVAGVNVPNYVATGDGASSVQNPLSYTTTIDTWNQSYTQTTTLPYEDGETATILINVPVPIEKNTSVRGDPHVSMVNEPDFVGESSQTSSGNGPIAYSTTTVSWDESYSQTTTLPLEDGTTATVLINVPVVVEASESVSDYKYPALTVSASSSQSSSIPLNENSEFVGSLSSTSQIPSITIKGKFTTSSSAQGVLSTALESEIISVIPIQPDGIVRSTTIDTEEETTEAEQIPEMDNSNIELEIETILVIPIKPDGIVRSTTIDAEAETTDAEPIPEMDDSSVEPETETIVVIPIRPDGIVRSTTVKAKAATSVDEPDPETEQIYVGVTETFSELSQEEYTSQFMTTMPTAHVTEVSSDADQISHESSDISVDTFKSDSATESKYSGIPESKSSSKRIPASLSSSSIPMAIPYRNITSLEDHDPFTFTTSEKEGEGVTSSSGTGKTPLASTTQPMSPGSSYNPPDIDKAGLSTSSLVPTLPTAETVPGSTISTGIPTDPANNPETPQLDLVSNSTPIPVKTLRVSVLEPTPSGIYDTPESISIYYGSASGIYLNLILLVISLIIQV
ncbi:uncharacterized protein J8A68_004240 [[Candida] subhashii]|uniref:Agglutinin-like protein N-terminal domain-containing protein n=1 Tax=[Candida] subhashii TaxID=561895 RepID=A0A8J5QT47_9ASCO|nr:uncharacterized protein J8A68_004240 [[Candida] subhashii]KAG7662230.1 hypothetical protein J8A68_004240 [[Candida] subhashii]